MRKLIEKHISCFDNFSTDQHSVQENYPKIPSRDEEMNWIDGEGAYLHDEEEFAKLTSMSINNFGYTIARPAN